MMHKCDYASNAPATTADTPEQAHHEHPPAHHAPSTRHRTPTRIRSEAGSERRCRRRDRDRDREEHNTRGRGTTTGAATVQKTHRTERPVPRLPHRRTGRDRTPPGAGNGRARRHPAPDGPRTGHRADRTRRRPRVAIRPAADPTGAGIGCARPQAPGLTVRRETIIGRGTSASRHEPVPTGRRRAARPHPPVPSPPRPAFRRPAYH